MIQRVLATLVILLAFGLRLYRLDGQSLWADEGASAFMTHRSAVDIVIAAAGDIHPPLYYLLLTGWSKLAGQSEFALRFLSVMFGTLLVALAFKLGTLLTNRTTAVAGAFFTAVSPLLIYYSQEARMYEQMAAFGTAAIVVSLASWVRPSRAGDSSPPATTDRRLLLLAAPLFALAVLSQYFGVTAMIAASLLFVLYHPAIRRDWRDWLRWAAVQLAAIAFVIPWLLYASNQLKSWSVDTEPLGPGEFFLRTIRTFSFGYAWDQTVTDKTTLLLAGILALAALWPLLQSDRPRALRGWTGTLLIAITPPLTLFLVAVNRPVYNPKFLLIGLPAFGLLQGCAVVALGALAGRLMRPRWSARPVAVAASSALALFMLFATGRALAAGYLDPKYGRDDYRGLVRYIEIAGRPGDGVILNAPGQSEIFGYYYGGTYPVEGFPAARPPELAPTERGLQEFTGKVDRVWLVLWASEQSDPEGIVEGWLNRNAFRTSNRWYGGVRLVLYTLGRTAAGEHIQVPETQKFESGIDLLGYSLATPVSRPGEALQLSLFWKPYGPISDRFTVFTHLIDSAELIWGQRDSEPVAGQRPTTTWSVNETIQDRYGIPVLAGTPPGDYFVELGMYRSQDGHRLGILDSSGMASSDRLLIGPVSIGPPDQQPSIEALGIQSPLNVSFGAARLLGYDFRKLGFEAGAVDFRPGDEAHLTTFWKAEQRPGRDRQLTYEVQDDSGRSVLRKTVDPTNGMFPSSQWSEGEMVRSQQRFVLPLAPGRYRLLAGLDGEKLANLTEFSIRP